MSTSATWSKVKILGSGFEFRRIVFDERTDKHKPLSASTVPSSRGRTLTKTLIASPSALKQSNSYISILVTSCNMFLKSFIFVSFLWHNMQTQLDKRIYLTLRHTCNCWGNVIVLTCTINSSDFVAGWQSSMPFLKKYLFWNSQDCKLGSNCKSLDHTTKLPNLMFNSCTQ